MTRITIVLLAALAASPALAQPATEKSTSVKVRDNPAVQYVLVKTVVGQSVGVVDARAEQAEPDGYNLLKYCWTPGNVLGDWAARAGLAGEMVTRALETLSSARDVQRAGH